MKNALYVENGRLTGNHPLLVTNKWLTEVDLNNIDYIDVKDSDYLLSYVFLYSILTKQIKTNKIRLIDCVYNFYYNNSEVSAHTYDTNEYYYYLMDDDFNVIFSCGSDLSYGDKKDITRTNDAINGLYNDIIDIPLNKDELIIKYMS